MHIGNSRQKGATLIVCMIILVVITFLGVGSIQDTTLEEKMAGNMKNRNTAFQAAESALRDAEDFIDSLTITSSFNGSNGLLGENDTEPDYFTDSTWTASSSIASINLNNVKTAPRYIIKYVVENDIDENSGLNIEDYSESTAGSTVTVFKIISRGTGSTDSAKVVLQTYYGKRF